jgi:UDP-glucose 4-epimerase
MSDKKNILVTGGAGYIGSHLAQLLCDKGYPVYVFDDFSTGLHENLDARLKGVIEGNILNNDDLEKAFSNSIHTVFHFAAFKAAGESMFDPGKFAWNNIAGSINLLNAMLKYEVKNIIFSSSAAVYGNPQYMPVDEKHPVNPTNYYGYTKLNIEQNLAWYSQLRGINYAALRYFNATGYDVKGNLKGKEKNPANLSPLVMEVAAGERKGLKVFGNDYKTIDGTGVRDYIHVSDLADAHVLAMEYIISESKDLLVNLGTGQGYSVLEVIKAAAKVTDREIPYELVARREGDPSELIASSDLAKDLLGWTTKYSDIENIFKTMVPVYLK